VFNLYQKSVDFLFLKNLSPIGKSLLHKEAIVLLNNGVAFFYEFLPEIQKDLLGQRLVFNLVLLCNFDDFWQQGKGRSLQILVLDLHVDKSQNVVNVLEILSKCLAVVFHKKRNHLQGELHVLVVRGLGISLVLVIRHQWLFNDIEQGWENAVNIRQQILLTQIDHSLPRGNQIRDLVVKLVAVLSEFLLLNFDKLLNNPGFVFFELFIAVDCSQNGDGFHCIGDQLFELLFFGVGKNVENQLDNKIILAFELISAALGKSAEGGERSFFNKDNTFIQVH
jgi:hypothetical protein